MLYTKQFEDGSGINLTKRMVVDRVRNTPAPDGWLKHTDFHWYTELNGKKLDYWPTKNKFQYDGQIYTGDVDDFICKRKDKTNG